MVLFLTLFLRLLCASGRGLSSCYPSLHTIYPPPPQTDGDVNLFGPQSLSGQDIADILSLHAPRPIQYDACRIGDLEAAVTPAASQILRYLSNNNCDDGRRQSSPPLSRGTGARSGKNDGDEGEYFPLFDCRGPSHVQKTSFSKWVKSHLDRFWF